MRITSTTPGLLILASSAFIFLSSCVEAHPLDTQCATWLPTSSASFPSSDDVIFAITDACVDCKGETCGYYANIVPCWTNDTGVFGHRVESPNGTDAFSSTIEGDCRINNNSAAEFAPFMFVPTKGPQWQQWKWVAVNAGDAVPANAIQHNGVVLGRLGTPLPFSCKGFGVVPSKDFSGFATVEANGKLSYFFGTTQRVPLTSRAFDVAVCDAVTTTPPPPSVTPNNTL